MLKIISAAAVVLLAAGTAHSQSAAPLSFEVASVKPAPPCCAAGQWREAKAGADRIDFPFATLRYCIAFSYRVKEYQVSGPAWLGTQQYAILAKGPEGTRHDQLPEMMQALLAERFKLQVHHETKEFNVVVLAVGKNGPSLKESVIEPGTPEGAAFGMSMNSPGAGRLEAKHANMTSLANTLSRMLGVPVVDKTGLTGRYDFDLEFTREDSGGMRIAIPSNGSPLPASEPNTSVFASIQHLGLKLDAQKVALDAIVVDRAEKAATEN